MLLCWAAIQEWLGYYMAKAPDRIVVVNEITTLEIYNDGRQSGFNRGGPIVVIRNNFGGKDDQYVNLQFDMLKRIAAIVLGKEETTKVLYEKGEE